MLALSWNVLDWRGPQFLGLYVGLMLGCVLLGWVLIAMMKRKGEALSKARRSELAEGMTAYDAAYLAGGKKQLVEAVVAALYRRGSVSMQGRKTLLPKAPPPDTAAEIERDVYATVRARGALSDLRSAAGLQAAVIRDRLMREGLLLEAADRLWIRLCVYLPFVFLLILGLSKINIGMMRDKPVLILVLLCGASVFLMIALPYRPHRTGRGDAVYKSLRSMHEMSLRGGDNPDEKATAAAWACAVFGPAVLVGELPGLHRYLVPPAGGSGTGGSGGGSGCDASSCGSSCGGGGCGGCGGCGD